MLCLTEKYQIIFSTKNLLNKRNKLVNKCKHENKFDLANCKTIITACLTHFSRNDYKIYFQ